MEIINHDDDCYVKLISYSGGCVGEENTSEKSNTNTLQDLVVYCARVSNIESQNNSLGNEKLLHYLIKNEHWSPFEMVSICLEIKTTRDIARQILRHRSFSFQEFSQRYSKVDTKFSLRECRTQDIKNRQNSLETSDEKLKTEWLDKQIELSKNAKNIYDWAIANGIAKEQARAVLPEGMTMSRMYMNGTLRSWIHYIKLRSSNGTQKEHQKIAIACAKAIEDIFPMIMDFCKT
jgi:thymidylate synthase (FAD)